jgi:erythromycin esterase
VHRSMPARDFDGDTAVTSWIRGTAWPVRSLDPSASSDDLAPLGDVFGPAAVIGIGESVRGVRGGHELYLLKHRLLRLAVDALGFRALALEEDEAVGAAIDHHLQTGEGDVRALLARAWAPWRTAEFLDVLLWLRARNTAHPDDPVRFVGVDGSEHDARALRTLAWHDTTGMKVVYWGGIAHTAVAGPDDAAAAPAGTNDGLALRRRLGPAYVSVGVTCLEGTATGPDRLPPPAGSTAESVLAESGLDRFVLDLHAQQPDAVRRWLNAPNAIRVIGPRYDPDDDTSYRMAGGSLARWFDVMAFIRRITPVHDLAP